MDYIFLAGVHGVGKSTLASKLESLIDIECISISDLIRRAGKKIPISEKNTAGISGNQELWKNELYKLNLKKTFMLLDGHFCLLNKNKVIFPLPLSTFENTNMTKIILVQHRPSIIRERLLSRDNISYSLELIEELQKCEIKRAKEYSRNKKIKLFIYNEDKPLIDLINFITD
ncbi:ATP-binding protein [Bacillus sp. 2CMS4F]|uniref:ATP-binding protein n=1 Tax=Bacillus TaxID=1386 RepID=UPI0020C122F1|nr:ATP-binding protein [Bacillus sp. 2CMS4F]MCK8098934.1 ATP-binding protein [Bacillus sp. 2CMS4F]